MPVENNPLNLITFFAILSLLPIIFVMTSSFIKISMVLLLTRESLGVQQVPPNMVIYCLSLILSFYIMSPVYNSTINSITDQEPQNAHEFIVKLQSSAQDTKKFLIKHTAKSQVDFFYQSIQELWPANMRAKVKRDDIVILVPAFMVTEITAAFKIGFLIYLPSIIIDIIVSNILMAMGMMMMSPQTISLPIKLLLFIILDGWSRLIHVLFNTYS